MAHRLHAVILGVLSALLGQALLNRRAIPRLARMPRGARRAAVLIPARNEAGAIAASVEAWARQDHPDYEVIVLDDDSADGTAEIARIAGAPYRHVRVVGGGPLVPGWHGKPSPATGCARAPMPRCSSSPMPTCVRSPRP
jgi:cellulose synthase/poly-beta-1,6-N-acetylglucosamine synthase-like glycosyltransferase